MGFQFLIYLYYQNRAQSTHLKQQKPYPKYSPKATETVPAVPT